MIIGMVCIEKRATMQCLTRFNAKYKVISELSSRLNCVPDAVGDVTRAI